MKTSRKVNWVREVAFWSKLLGLIGMVVWLRLLADRVYDLDARVAAMESACSVHTRGAP